MNQPRSPKRLPFQELLLQLYGHTKLQETTMDDTSVVYSLKIYTASIEILLMRVDKHQHGIAYKIQIKELDLILFISGPSH
jgi:hypothetical protein